MVLALNSNGSDKTIAIISPCFNENKTVIKFIEVLEEAIRDLNYDFNIIIVDDCSTDNTLQLLSEYTCKNNHCKLTILSLETNLGHQGAIYQGLMFAKTLSPEKYIILDSDGEDDPTAIQKLLDYQQYDIVHVSRGKRNESLTFIFSYSIYKLLFRLITNKQMNYGNYCMINDKIANSVINKSFVHLAAFLSKEHGTRHFIKYDRKKRIDGKSKMNMSSLVYHAFKSLIEYAESLLMLFLKLFAVIMVIFVFLISNVFYQKFVTHTAISGWFSILSIGLLNLALTCIGFFVIGLLLLNISNNRKNIRIPIFKQISSTTSKHTPNDTNTKKLGPDMGKGILGE